MLRQTQLSPRTCAVFAACLGLCTLALPSSGSAALSLNNTRVIFDSDKRSTSVVINNPSVRPYAVQAWVNTLADDTSSAVPFIPSPPLFRLEPGKEQMVQINGLPTDLPEDRESLFFFNVQEIPQTHEASGNVLNIAMRTRIKLFYRPAQLQGNPLASLKDLKFSLESGKGQAQLRVHNPTPYHMTFIRLEIKGGGQHHSLKEAEMISPFGQRAYPISGVQPKAGLQAEFSVINDYGGYSAPTTLPITLAP
ncbi:putative fimbrial chaperone YadV [Pseudomonas reidholzensis]|uniref:Putative fimbrial chaperone YadV n=1 Tax=Pseudomonas reidholzensis TaxID=1785162 RepID=A0A383S077_9PSED|nr:molecular chaperone [Pseudomonas reidholzensis]SYX92038.1 putative fimbrial chaperone YadV [Pseudomonas reidholzensis]